ncbi:1-deoxy-D-xylulose 5-phosphate reductoisomerase [Desulfurella amilsii]|uniref:1-deoxy-D-xylulose 5-phosphate reductoisomerase n=1 Tax=Desulfurella amilsii TaxID=1562698 RepID=A0A1X4XZU3_9BACT|nr:1-deoxy-D-xylulose-5-phosphate reductoisomerase [Desulfurella amilsii]OSS43055.1 1-deoxy-D-xylulose 5-phosphate reductoisomerase [Desulfurella amilsii]
MENILILGSTGSIGQNAIEIIKKGSKYNIIGIAFNKNISKAIEQIKLLKPKYVYVAKADYIEQLKQLFPTIKYFTQDALVDLIAKSDVDFVINAFVGSAGILPSYYAIYYKKKFALANKESLVVAGKILTDLAKKNNIEIIPIDSEHSAIYQCLDGKRQYLNKIILTASGGPFRQTDKEQFANITKEMALHHPKWNMGAKITIDSATMMNKGFEVIEAGWLFDLESHQIEVVVHKECVMHSAVEFIDGSIIAQMALPDMKLPIAYALYKPHRIEFKNKLSFVDIGSLTFEKPDLEKFELLALAQEAFRKKDKNLGLLLNAADEVCVEHFLENKIKFTDIPKIIKQIIVDFEDNLSNNIFELQAQTQMIKTQTIKLIEKTRGF